MKRFYITTPLYYINDKPHLGTAYSTILADVLNRYHQLMGYDTFLMTGTDEHGQKVSRSAQKSNMPIQAYCDQTAQTFEHTWGLLGVSYDRFFRTTADWHKQAVQKYLQVLYDNDQIYTSHYEGWYSESEELFYTSKDLIEGKSPTGKEVTKIKEKNYFFKMSAYQEQLIKHIEQNPDFIQPAFRKNEVLSFLKNKLEDLCISRPKSRLDWGVTLPFDSQYVTYVWVDALLNYVTGIGGEGASLPIDKASSLKAPPKGDFKKWWEEARATHLIGKDILITHCVYWPCLLMALKLKLPKTIMAHGWLLNPEKEKMSKSKGAIMDPLELLKLFDADSLRYFLIKDVAVGKDAQVSIELITRRVNEDLANNLGNLFSRTTKMIHRHFHSQIPARGKNTNTDTNTDTDTDTNTDTDINTGKTIIQLRELGIKTAEEIKKDIVDLRPDKAVAKIVHLLNETNKFLEQSAPWKTVKTDKDKTAEVLRTALEVLYLCAVCLKPVMPQKMDLLLKSLHCPDEWPVPHFERGTFPVAGKTLPEIPPLFPRLAGD